MKKPLSKNQKEVIKQLQQKNARLILDEPMNSFTLIHEHNGMDLIDWPKTNTIKSLIRKEIIIKKQVEGIKERDVFVLSEKALKNL
jgi:hypothetical protein